ncbi:hypothetical protein [Microbispora sp. GKU 823]|uniref:hypothetical protein n=1 Tax=Microbispora sp. GKU 823 TaxID=1652100 RepID=UPI0009A279C1|nr:hypothetical protein [Microbispora sp. GKU 823]OPG08645.1 hypothetical protein B1L11_27790 [Microbispora sp. GKU 823]
MPHDLLAYGLLPYGPLGGLSGLSGRGGRRGGGQAEPQPSRPQGGGAGRVRREVEDPQRERVEVVVAADHDRFGRGRCAGRLRGCTGHVSGRRGGHGHVPGPPAGRGRVTGCPRRG